MWHVTCNKWHVTCFGRWTFSQNFSSLALTVCDLWYYEDLEEKADWLTHLWSDEAVYRKAPATPGLLNTRLSIIDGPYLKLQPFVIWTSGLSISKSPDKWLSWTLMRFKPNFGHLSTSKLIQNRPKWCFVCVWCRSCLTIHMGLICFGFFKEFGSRSIGLEGQHWDAVHCIGWVGECYRGQHRRGSSAASVRWQ